jgi:hypothetical protein
MKSSKTKERPLYFLPIAIGLLIVVAFAFTNYKEHVKAVSDAQNISSLAHKVSISPAESSKAAIDAIRLANSAIPLFLITNLKGLTNTSNDGYGFFVFDSNSHKVQAVEYLHEDAGIRVCSYVLALPDGALLHMASSSSSCPVSPIKNGGEWLSGSI